MQEKIKRNYTNKEKSVSTNNDLKEVINGTSSPVFQVISAESQQGGRGRQGKTFFSPRGGVYFSASYPISGKEKNIPFFTLLTGVAVRRSLKEICGADTLIKWPNDIYLNGKKLCGILCELVSCGEKCCAVAGVGINSALSSEEIPAELTEKITALSIENIAVPNTQALIENIVEKLDDFVYAQDCLNTIPENIITELNSCSYLKGKSVTYEGKSAVCGDINSDGSINLDFGNKTERVFFGTIET